jgi:hypothetical protein
LVTGQSTRLFATHYTHLVALLILTSMITGKVIRPDQVLKSVHSFRFHFMSDMEDYDYLESTKKELFKPVLLSIPGSKPESPHLSSPSIEVGVVRLSESRFVSEARGEDSEVLQLVKSVGSVHNYCLISEKDFTTIETIEERMLPELKAVTDQQKETKAKMNQMSTKMDEMSIQMDEMKDKLEVIIRAIYKHADELKQGSAPYLVQLQRRTESDDRLCESLMIVSQTHVTEV